MEFYWSRYIAIAIILAVFVGMNDISLDVWTVLIIWIVATLLSLKKPW